MAGQVQVASDRSNNRKLTCTSLVLHLFKRSRGQQSQRADLHSSTIDPVSWRLSTSLTGPILLPPLHSCTLGQTRARTRSTSSSTGTATRRLLRFRGQERPL